MQKLSCITKLYFRFQSALKPSNAQVQESPPPLNSKLHTISSETLQLISGNTPTTIPTFPPQTTVQNESPTSLNGNNSVSYWGFVDQLPLGCDVPDVTSAMTSGGNKEAWMESVQENGGGTNVNGGRLDKSNRIF